MEHRDYETLAAAHVLRAPTGAAVFGPVVKATAGRLFGNVFLRDVVLYGVDYFLSTGRILPASALKVDVRLFGREGGSRDNYEKAIDEVFGIPERTILDTKDHVGKTIVEETQTRLLLQADLSSMLSREGLAGFWKMLEQVKTISGAGMNGVVHNLSESLLDALRDPPRGIPTGIEALDDCLSAGGPSPGETLLFFGRYAIGKSILMAHAARYGALQGKVVVYWACGDGSQKTLLLRLAKGFLGWTDAKLREDPDRAYQAYMAEFGHLKLFPLWSPASRADRGRIEAVLDSVEAKAGRKVDLLAMDYSEKRAAGREWNSVADAYTEMRDICGARGIVGLDAAQENQSGRISYFNLLKDADTGVQLTVMPPSEWRRKQASMKGEDKEPPQIPTRGPVWGEIIRAREGVSNLVFELWVDRETGQVKPRERGKEEK